jgi:hypothetical protein
VAYTLPLVCFLQMFKKELVLWERVGLVVLAVVATGMWLLCSVLITIQLVQEEGW